MSGNKLWHARVCVCVCALVLGGAGRINIQSNISTAFSPLISPWFRLPCRPHPCLVPTTTTTTTCFGFVAYLKAFYLNICINCFFVFLTIFTFPKQIFLWPNTSWHIWLLLLFLLLFSLLLHLTFVTASPWINVYFNEFALLLTPYCRPIFVQRFLLLLFLLHLTAF